MPGGPKKFHTVYQFGRKRAKNKKRAKGTTSRDTATDQQATLVAKTPDNGDGGDSGSTSRGPATDAQVTRGAGVSDNGSPLNKGTTSRGSTTGQQATRGDAGDSDLQYDGILRADSGRVIVAARGDAGDSDLQNDGFLGTDSGRVIVAARGDAGDTDLQNDGILRADTGRVRVDARTVTSSEIAQVSARDQVTLDRLESTPATARKTAVFTDASDASSASAVDNAALYAIVDLNLLNVLLAALQCKVCGGCAKLVTGDRDYGLAKKLVVLCENCGEVAAQWNSRRVDGEKTCNPFEINMLATRAMLSSGNGQTAMNDIFASMGLSRRGLHNKTFQRHLKKTLEPAATRAAATVMTRCAKEVTELYDDICFGHKKNIAVCYDGTWLTRGHSSHIGVGTVVELFTGYVLDYHVMSNFCLGCENGPKPDSEGYDLWKLSHQCQKNTSCKSGQMEVEAGKILFERSLQRHNLRYTTMLCDGDSRTYNAIREAKVYGYIEVEKEDCVNHVRKRMGTALRNLLQKHKGEGKRSLGGKGRLTAELVDRLAIYYGRALKSHVGDVEAMSRAVMATFYHVTSTDSCPNHALCPAGEQSWCPHNAAKAKGEPEPRHKYNLPSDVAAALLPVYQRLSEKSLLQRCLRGRTQNSNESLHSVIWSLLAKEQHWSLVAVQAAVAEAVLRFNAGNEYAAAAVLSQLDMNITPTGSSRAKEKDLRRSTSSSKKRAASLGLAKAVKKKHHDSMHPDYSPGSF
ncbi:uncharacterized protein LOC125944722 [Dermacentor silvarum]|uniref:uncharacterized protein LOC125944722 n=1 Tax=Dermacentor silvarum TaxID=543639 RepID=UPI002100B82D|nr:uncharacterized protein LOC125944722 [Dermacentor silvarum]